MCIRVCGLYAWCHSVCCVLFVKSVCVRVLYVCVYVYKCVFVTVRVLYVSVFVCHIVRVRVSVDVQAMGQSDV